MAVLAGAFCCCWVLLERPPNRPRPARFGGADGSSTTTAELLRLPKIAAGLTARERLRRGWSRAGCCCRGVPTWLLVAGIVWGSKPR